MKRIALIGTGYWGSRIEKYISQYFDLALKGGSSLDLNQIWQDESIEGVIIATPIKTHYDLARQALEAKKHVLVEKPIALTVDEANELVSLSTPDHLLGVEYTQMFSPSVNLAAQYVNDGVIGNVEHIEMSTKHLGRFMEDDVFWLLASHHLSILSLFTDLSTLKTEKHEYMYHNALCTTGSIVFESESLTGRIDVSTNYPGKEMCFTVYGSKGTVQYDALAEHSVVITNYKKEHALLPDELTTGCRRFKYDEKNNLRYSLEYFDRLMSGKVRSNAQVAADITTILVKPAEYGNAAIHC